MFFPLSKELLFHPGKNFNECIQKHFRRTEACQYEVINWLTVWSGLRIKFEARVHPYTVYVENFLFPRILISKSLALYHITHTTRSTVRHGLYSTFLANNRGWESFTYSNMLAYFTVWLVALTIPTVSLLPRMECCTNLYVPTVNRPTTGLAIAWFKLRRSRKNQQITSFFLYTIECPF